jgi:hypothetical protein
LWIFNTVTDGTTPMGLTTPIIMLLYCHCICWSRNTWPLQHQKSEHQFKTLSWCPHFLRPIFGEGRCSFMVELLGQAHLTMTLPPWSQGGWQWLSKCPWTSSAIVWGQRADSGLSQVLSCKLVLEVIVELFLFGAHYRHSPILTVSWLKELIRYHGGVRSKSIIIMCLISRQDLDLLDWPGEGPKRSVT